MLGDENARFSYAIGLKLGSQWKQIGFAVNNDQLVSGLKDAQTGGPALLSPQELNDVLAQFQKKMQAKAMAMQAEMAAKSKVEGETFLTTNKNNPGVVTLPSGLEYKVLTAGDGPIPNASSMVTVNYRGTLINGTEFDSSAKVGHPLQINVTGGIIKGWTEALQLMKVGSKWQLFVPSNLAYGERGTRGIPPNTALIFEVELLGIQAPKAPPVTPAPAAKSMPLTSDIIMVPSAKDLTNGAQIQTIKAEDIQKFQASQTNAAGK